MVCATCGGPLIGSEIPGGLCGHCATSFERLDQLMIDLVSA
jgi:hypothetical protein